MAIGKDISHLQQQIAHLEEEKEKLSMRLNSMKNDYINFKNSYEQSFSTVTQQINQLTCAIQSLRQQIETIEAEIVGEETTQEETTQTEENARQYAEETVKEPIFERQENTQAKEPTTAPKEETFSHDTDKKSADKSNADISFLDELTEKVEEWGEKISAGFDWEKFIGENLISKLGILILLIGVVIGGKYAFDHQLISPAMRILIGTVLGFSLLGVSFKLKAQYENFSAILASGSVAILYFMTFFAYHLYHLIPMPVAFGLMTATTAGAIALAWSYNREIIALIGLVAAYVIPFILSDGSNDSPWVLFSYIAIINIGVLIISIKKYWRILFVSAFGATWLIIGSIYRLGEWPSNADTTKMMLFQAITFLTFYATFLAYKVRKCLFFQHFDILFLLSNSFTFYGLGYNTLYNSDHLSSYVGMFTLFNAILHTAVSIILYMRNMVDQSVRRLIIGLAISFLTIALLVWMTGHWLTIFWILEAAVLFIVSRVSKRPFYERMSYPIFFLALISLVIDWGNPNGGHLEILTPIFDTFARIRAIWDVTPENNVQGHILSIVNTSLFALIAALVVYIDQRFPAVESDEEESKMTKIFSQGLSIMAIFVVTSAFLVHLDAPWFIIAWAIEAIALCYFGRKKSNPIFEGGAYVVLLLQLCFIPWVLFKLNPYDINYRSRNAFQFTFEFKEIWQSLIAFLAIAATSLGQLFAINQSPSEEGVAEKHELSPILRTVLFTIATLAILTHTQWIVTTILLFVGTIGCFFWVKRHDRMHIELLAIAIITSMVSLTVDWIGILSQNQIIGTSITSLLATLSIGAMLYLGHKEATPPLSLTTYILRILVVSIPFICLVLDITKIMENNNIHSNIITMYALCTGLHYFTVWSFVVIRNKWSRYETFATTMAGISFALFFLFGLSMLYSMNNHFTEERYAILFHYTCILSLLIAGWVILIYYKKNHSLENIFTILKQKEANTILNSILYLGVVTLIGYEISYIGTCLGHEEPYGMALSIFLGVAALFGIYFGLYKEMKYIRIEGIILTAITVLKLFFYDMAHFDTIHKTIAFISIGLLMLVISFSYQKIAKAKEKERLAFQTQAEKEEAEEKSDEQ